MARRPLIVTLAALALALAAAALRLSVGPEGLGAPFWETPPFILQLRLDRVFAGAVIGAALATAGVLLQALLRNPLAAPGILGLTSGASLGVAISVYASYAATGAIILNRAPLTPAVVGSLLALLAVYLIAQRRGLIEPVALILVGVVVSVICGAATMFIQHLLPDAGVALSSRWLLGAISDDLERSRIALVGAGTLLAVGVGAWLGPAMDAATLSDDEARSVGLRLAPMRLALFGLAGLLTAGTVTLAGPIGFVGLVCPHAVRLLQGPSHRSLVVASALSGAALILFADSLVRVINLGSGRMPIGVLTALVGGPAFLYLLRREWTHPTGGGP